MNLIGAQPERIYIQFSPAKLAGYGLTPATLMAALQAQNVVVPSGDITTEAETIKLRVSGALQVREGHPRRQLRRGRSDPATGRHRRSACGRTPIRRSPIFRINGKPGLGLSISMRDGGDVLALGRNIEQTMQELKANLPIGIEPIMVANQPETVSKSINEFMEALWESIAIVLVVSVVSLGLRAGAIVIVSIPLVLAVVFGAMQALEHRPSAHLSRRPHHRARPAGGRRHDHHREHGLPPGTRRQQGAGRCLRLRLHRLSAAHRNAGHHRGVPARGPRPQRCRRIHLFAVRRGGPGAACPPGWSPACLHRLSAWRCCAPRSIRMARPWVRRCACSGAACWRRCGPSGSPSRSRLLCSSPLLPAPVWCRSSSFPPPTAPSFWWI